MRVYPAKTFFLAICLEIGNDWKIGIAVFKMFLNTAIPIFLILFNYFGFLNAQSAILSEWIYTTQTVVVIFDASYLILISHSPIVNWFFDSNRHFRFVIELHDPASFISQKNLNSVKENTRLIRLPTFLPKLHFMCVWIKLLFL